MSEQAMAAAAVTNCYASRRSTPPAMFTSVIHGKGESGDGNVDGGSDFTSLARWTHASQGDLAGRTKGYLGREEKAGVESSPNLAAQTKTSRAATKYVPKGPEWGV